MFLQLIQLVIFSNILAVRQNVNDEKRPNCDYTGRKCTQCTYKISQRDKLKMHIELDHNHYTEKEEIPTSIVNSWVIESHDGKDDQLKDKHDKGEKLIF